MKSKELLEEVAKRKEAKAFELAAPKLEYYDECIALSKSNTKKLEEGREKLLKQVDAGEFEEIKRGHNV